MDLRARSRSLMVVATVGTVVVLGSVLAMLLRHRSPDVFYGLFLFHNAPTAIVLLWMGFLVLGRRPRHVAGRILLAIGVIHVVHVLVAVITDVLLVAAGVDQPLVGEHGLVSAELPLGAAIGLWIMNWLWVPAAVLAVTLLVVFPDGWLPGTRWRPVVVLAAIGLTLLLAATGIDGWPTSDWTADETPAVVLILLAAGGVAMLGVVIAGVGAFVQRWRRAGRERRRFEVVGAIACLFAVLAVVTYPWPWIWTPTVLVTLNVLVIAYAVAVVRLRLHDLDPIIGRSAVAVVLSALVAVVYVVLVVGVGRLVGTGIDDPVLPLVAVAVVALLIEPARRRVRRLVDRWLYGARAERSDVLSRLADRASGPASTPELLQDVTELLLRSTGATRAEAWIGADPDLVLGAAAGADADGKPIAKAGVWHGEEPFGELRLHAKAAADLAPEAHQVLADVAHLLGIVLRNQQLTGRLREQLAQLSASRLRLVEAQDAARRGLERDIHDGAQSRLIALRLRIGALRVASGARSDDALRDELDEMGDDLDTAVRSLRELARGLQPPILEHDGVAAALRAHVRDLSVPITVAARGTARYPRAVEAAAYFSCLESVQNAMRHGDSTEIAIELDCDPAELRLSVKDNGAGFDPDLVGGGSGLANIGDRISALGGHVDIRSSPEHGTTVTATIPASMTSVA